MERRASMGTVVPLGGAALLILAGVVPSLRPWIVPALVLGWLAARRAGDRAVSLGWAAAIPLALDLAWPWALGVDAPMGAACADAVTVIALRRIVLVAAVATAVACLARREQATAWLRLRLPGPVEGAVAVAGLLALSVGGLVVGPWLAEPFFGPLDFPRPLGALLPAVLFGVSNGVAEELAYRGALLGWLERAGGLRLALVVQAIVFGLAHAGNDVVAFLPIHVTAMALLGLVAGVIAVRTRSLAIPIAAHVGADIALYFGLACRPAL